MLALFDKLGKIQIVKSLHEQFIGGCRDEVGGRAVMVQDGDRLTVGLGDNTGRFFFRSLMLTDERAWMRCMATSL